MSSQKQSQAETGLTYHQQKQGMFLTFFAASAGGVLYMFLGGSAIAALMIKQMGGSDFQAMLPASITIAFRAIQMVVAMKIAPGKGHRFMIWMWNVAAIAMMLAILSPSVIENPNYKVLTFLILISLAQFFNAMAGTFWFPMLHDLIPVHMRGRFFGRLRAIWNTWALLLILSAGWFLGKSPEMWKYQVVLLAGVFMFVMRTGITRMIPTGNSLSGDLDFADWKHYVRGVFHHRPLLTFLAYYITLGFLMGFICQPLVLYMKARGLPTNDNIFVYCFNTFGMVLTFLAVGNLVDKLGTKKIFLATHLVLCLVSFFVVLIGFLPLNQFKYLMPVAMAFSGGMIGASGVACTAQLFHLVPNRGRAFYMSLSMVMIWSSQALSPLIVGWLAGFLGENWTLDIMLWKFDVFQLAIAAAGVTMLLIISLLTLIADVRPGNTIKEK